MGYIKHDAILVTVYADIIDAEPPDIDAFRASLPREWRHLVVGPLPSVISGYASYAFLPDGSKEGWPTSEDGDRYRGRFVALFDDAADIVHLRFGGDDPDRWADDPRDLTHEAECRGD